MKQKNSTLILILFLLGIFMGAIDNGIVSPARELIQNSFGVDKGIGTWMITLYTLVYAVSMPIVSKLADKYGFKKIYILGITLFGFGSFLDGMSNFYGNFTFFLIARVIQAVGGGGIIPIANAFIGRSFPEEKRGTALGLVGAMYGVATILGPTLGSSILNIAGNSHWGWLFFINIPISIFILVLSSKMENIVSTESKAMDLAGSIVLAGAIGSLMYALTELDFFNFFDSITSTKVYPFLLIFLILTPILFFIENKAEDPVLNPKYFKSRQMVTIFLLAFIIGIGMMGMVFVPQFGENVLKLKAGNGGYLVTFLAVFSGIAAPISGKMLDKKGAKLVIALGFIFNILGTLFLGFVATKYLNFTTVFIGLALMGFGVGFTMGAPLNYLVLQNVPENESASGLATMSLIRSIGVTISPSIMIGFIVDASKKLQPALMSLLQNSFANTMPKGMNLASMAGDEKSSKAFEALQNADVTTIVNDLKNIFSQLLPTQAKTPVLNSLNSTKASIESLFQSTINKGYTHMFVAAAIIAAIGVLATLLLSNPNKKAA